MRKTPLKPIALIGAVWICTAFTLTFSDGNLPPARKHTVRILTYNIHHASPPSTPDKTDLDAIARVINEQSPDLVALQEVDVFTSRSGPFDQAKEIAKRTGMTAHFFKSIDYEGGQYGIAILSRLPVTETNRFPLPRRDGHGGEPRILATATVELSAKDRLVFACTHLDSKRDSVNRFLQIRAIEGLLKDTDLPVVIAGDFNSKPGSQVINLLDKNFKRTCHPCDFTIPVDHPDRAIDFIAFTPQNYFQVKEHRVIPEHYASDHFPVLAVLEIKL